MNNRSECLLQWFFSLLFQVFWGLQCNCRSLWTGMLQHNYTAGSASVCVQSINVCFCLPTKCIVLFSKELKITLFLFFLQAWDPSDSCQTILRVWKACSIQLLWCIVQYVWKGYLGYFRLFLFMQSQSHVWLIMASSLRHKNLNAAN